MLDSFFKVTKFIPYQCVHTVYEIDFDKLYKDGYRAVIFDVDNTLVPHGEPADERAKELFAHLKELGFSCMLLSNNKEPRVKMFNDVVQVNYIFKANKPMPGNYKKAMEIMGTTTENTLFVGDQIFTDVMGGNFAKMKTILVEPFHLEKGSRLPENSGMTEMLKNWRRPSFSRLWQKKPDGLLLRKPTASMKAAIPVLPMTIPTKVPVIPPQRRT